MDDIPNRSFRAEVQRLRDRGWQVVRLRGGTKMAFERNWPTLVRAAADFQPGDNVGCRFGPESGGLVDIDLDYDTARALVAHPVFGLHHLVEFGRESLPAGRRGHRLVIVPDAPNRSRQFAVRTREGMRLLRGREAGLTVVEIRGSNGSQTAFPPSSFKDGDRLIWTASEGVDATIPEMSWKELNRRVGRLAFASLAAAMYPAGETERDAFCIALFGTLVEAGVDLPSAQHMANEVARLAGDEAERDLLLDHDGEGLAEFLDISGLRPLDHVIRSWLDLQPEKSAAPQDRQRRPDHDHVQGEVTPGRIDAETLQRLLDVLDPRDFAAYHDHLAIVQAAHHATGGDRAAREVVVAWSARNPDYGPGRRNEHGKLWAEVVRGLWNRSKIRRDGPITTLATILHHISAAGRPDLVATLDNGDAVEEDFIVYELEEEEVDHG